MGGQKKEKGPSGRRLCPRQGMRKVPGRAAQSQGFCVNSEPAPGRETSPPVVLSSWRKRGAVFPCPCPPSRGGVPPALTCMWLLRARRGATSPAFGGDALGADPASLGSFPRHCRPAMGTSRTLRGFRTPPAQPLHPGRGSAVAGEGRARGLWGHVKTPRQKFRAQVTSQINIVSLSDLTGR